MSIFAPRLILFAVLLAACSGPAPSPSPVDTAAPSSPAIDVTPDPSAEYPDGSLPAFLAADGRFGIFLALMEADGLLLARLLDTPEREFTLFLPTDLAFTRLGPETQAALSTDAELVTGIVERHFMHGRLEADEFATGFIFTGMNRRSSRIAIATVGDQAYFGEARIIESDVAVAGGIVHVIDGVNLGPTPDRIPNP